MSLRSDGCSDMGNAFWLDGMTNLAKSRRWIRPACLFSIFLWCFPFSARQEFFLKPRNDSFLRLPSTSDKTRRRRKKNEFSRTMFQKHCRKYGRKYTKISVEAEENKIWVKITKASMRLECSEKHFANWIVKINYPPRLRLSIKTVLSLIGPWYALSSPRFQLSQLQACIFIVSRVRISF